MTSTDYMFHHLACVWRVVRGDALALEDMDISSNGFWRSFFAIPASIPALLFVYALTARAEVAAGGTRSVSEIVVTEFALEMAMWIGSIIVLAYVLRLVGMVDRYSHLIIARNWAAVLFNYIIAMAFLPALFAGADTELTGITMIIAFVAMIYIAIRLTRVALATSYTIATAFVVGEIIILLFVAGLIYSLISPS